MKISDRERDALEHLRDAKTIAREWDGWLTPMFCGGRDASHHSRTLAQLVRKGLAERKERGCGLHFQRPSYFYRITASGLAELESHR